ncbi:aldehyde dehydrogenase family protein [uncultured Marinobacter sp.]|uniref:aldehyde dehydrogenase family protein n=1 Tax=uncultured Marinobacter sp. TaxID=187379 RepID=UPI0030DDB66E|tara:strand:- start:1082 stop:2515 length:1434 start_codon:yes stop_codon:yes gene_type:complete
MIDFDRNYQMTINGHLVGSANTLEVINPATKSTIARVPDATREVLDSAVAAARAAFPAWSQSGLAQRQAMLTQIADAMEIHADEFMALLTREQGKPRTGAQWEVLGAVTWFREIATQALEDEIVEESDTRRVVTKFPPLGVVGAITPWNFPILLAVWKIAPALLTGNTIVVKPSPFTPLCMLKLGELCSAILPPGVVNVVTGGDEIGKWITTHPDVDKIAFTGHTETGKHVMRSAAGTLKRVTLELGGNDPAVVLPDVNPKAIAPHLFWAAFENNAQFCNVAKRIYIHEQVYDQVLSALVDFAKSIKVGDGAEPDTGLGPIQNYPQYQKVLQYIDDCKKHGYRFAIGGDVDVSAKGWFIPITIVDNPPDDSRIVAEEPFGPIVPVLKWRTEEEVIKRANQTRYGLGASVWGNDAAALERIGSQIDAGTVWINEIHQYSPHQAFGGHKESGVGCESSLHGLMEYTNWKTITLNKRVDF